jgi:hypothetical protein
MEKLQQGETLKFRLSPTFGGMIVILELNPAYPKKNEKRYLLWLGKTEEHARRDNPYDTSAKAKKLAGWVSERWPQWLQEAPLAEKAA